MKLSNPIQLAEGIFKYPAGQLSFHLFNNPSCIQISQAILAGHTYPPVPTVQDVRAILDIGANIGAATVFLATTYPAATVYALEPGSLAFLLLSKNVASLPNVHTFNFGVFSSAKTLPLYPGKADSVESSIWQSDRTESEPETISLVSAGQFLTDQHISQIDILKLDTEGCEVPILRATREYLPTVKLIYVEYHSDRDRRLIDEILATTHVLWRGHSNLVHRGEFCYLRRDLLPPERETQTCEILVPLD